MEVGEVVLKCENQAGLGETLALMWYLGTWEGREYWKLWEECFHWKDVTMEGCRVEWAVEEKGESFLEIWVRLRQKKLDDVMGLKRGWWLRLLRDLLRRREFPRRALLLR